MNFTIIASGVPAGVVAVAEEELLSSFLILDLLLSEGAGHQGDNNQKALLKLNRVKISYKKWVDHQLTRYLFMVRVGDESPMCDCLCLNPISRSSFILSERFLLGYVSPSGWTHTQHCMRAPHPSQRQNPRKEFPMRLPSRWASTHVPLGRNKAPHPTPKKHSR